MTRLYVIDLPPPGSQIEKMNVFSGYLFRKIFLMPCYLWSAIFDVALRFLCLQDVNVFKEICIYLRFVIYHEVRY